MNRTLMFLFLIVAGGLTTLNAQVHQKPAVIVELFTSEGCSSCPPADALLMDLDQKQPAGSPDIVALGFHVDYWNHLAWTDRFSSAQFSRRQSDYGTRFQLDSVYTPQMVIDGRYQFVGSDAAGIREAIARSASAVKPAAISLHWTGPDRLQVEVENAGPAQAEVLIALTEDGLATHVRSGENSGRDLRHAAVVRYLRSLGNTRDGRFSASVSVPEERDWKVANQKIAVWVQKPTQGEVVGAAVIAASAQSTRTGSSR